MYIRKIKWIGSFLMGYIPSVVLFRMSGLSSFQWSKLYTFWLFAHTPGAPSLLVHGPNTLQYLQLIQYQYFLAQISWLLDYFNSLYFGLLYHNNLNPPVKKNRNKKFVNKFLT